MSIRLYFTTCALSLFNQIDKCHVQISMSGHYTIFFLLGHLTFANTVIYYIVDSKNIAKNQSL